jgi:hypothetical protein
MRAVRLLSAAHAFLEPCLEGLGAMVRFTAYAPG